jgi:hypothetical protein
LRLLGAWKEELAEEEAEEVEEVDEGMAVDDQVGRWMAVGPAVGVLGVERAQQCRARRRWLASAWTPPAWLPKQESCNRKGVGTRSNGLAGSRSYYIK